MVQIVYDITLIFINKIENSVVSMTGCLPYIFLYTFVNHRTSFKLNNEIELDKIILEIKNYLKLKIISNVCASFLQKSKDLYSMIYIDNIDISKSLLFDLFKPFIEIYIDDYLYDNNNNDNIVNVLFTKNTIFCYLSKFLFRYEQYLFYKNYQTIKKDDILSIHQFLMGSGKSTVIIPYLVYNNYINGLKTMILIPDNLKIKEEMLINIDKVLMLFNVKSVLFKKNKGEKYDDFLKNNKIVLLTYSEIKHIFCFLVNKNLMSEFIVYIDEVDMFLDPCTCEYNLK